MHTKEACCIFKTMFTIQENTLNYVQNPLKYKKLYNKLYLNFLIDKVCLNKILLLSSIKGSIFGLTENIILILSITKKASELSFCSRFKIYVLFVSKLLDLLLFLKSREIFLTKQFFHSQINFPWSRKFSKVKEVFHKMFDQVKFLQSK